MKEIKRFHIALQRGRGLRIELTPGSTRKVWRELAKAGEGSRVQFDYGTQEAIICKSTDSISQTQTEGANCASI